LYKFCHFSLLEQTDVTEMITHPDHRNMLNNNRLNSVASSVAKAANFTAVTSFPPRSSFDICLAEGRTDKDNTTTPLFVTCDFENLSYRQYSCALALIIGMIVRVLRVLSQQSNDVGGLRWAGLVAVNIDFEYRLRSR
jgi:hypothetical protein